MYTQITTIKNFYFIYFFCIIQIMQSTRQNNSINAISNARMLINELRSNLSREETKRIREKPYKKEAIYNFLKEKDC